MSSGAKVTYSGTMLNGGGQFNSGARAGVSYAEAIGMQGYMPSGTGRGTLADVKYEFTMRNEHNICVWANETYGLVVTEGLNSLIDARFKTGLASPANYMLLLDGAAPITVDAADTISGSHAGWTENVDYSDTWRPTITLGAIVLGSADNSAAECVYHFTGTGTLAGAAIVDEHTKGGSSGSLYDVGAFFDGPKPYKPGYVLSLATTIVISAA